MTTQTRKPTPTPRRSRLRFLVAAGGLYLAFRILFATTVPWHIDQFAVGNLAHGLTDGTLIPFWFYSWPRWTHGAVLLSPLIYLGFLLFGQYNYVLSGLALLLSLGTCLGWVYLADRFASRRLAVLVGAAFVLAPPYWNTSAPTLWGVHTESTFFAILSLIALFHLLEKGIGWRGAAALGLLSGFGVLFSLHGVFAAAVLVLFWAVHDGLRKAWRPLLIYGACAALAYFPSVLYNLVTGERYGYYLLPRQAAPDGAPTGWLGWFLSRFVDKAWDLIRLSIANSPDFTTAWKSHAYMLLVLIAWGALLVGFALALGRNRIGGIWDRLAGICQRQPVHALAFLFPAVYLAVYTVGPMSNPDPGNAYFLRYLVLLYPIYFVLLATLFERFRKASLPLIAVALLAVGYPQILPFPAANAYLAHPDRISLLQRMKGFDPWRLHFDSVPFYIRSLSEERRAHALDHVVAKTAGPERMLASLSAGTNHADYFANVDAARAGHIACIRDPERRPFAMGMGYDHAGRLVMRADSDVDFMGWRALLQANETGTEDQARRLAENYAAGMGWSLTTFVGAGGLSRLYAHAQSDGQDSWDYQSLGYTDQPREHLRRARKVIAAVPEQLFASFLFGVGIAFGFNRDIIENVNPDEVLPWLFGPKSLEHLDSFHQGFGYGTGMYLLRHYWEIPDRKLQRMMRLGQNVPKQATRGLEAFCDDWFVSIEPVKNPQGHKRIRAR